MPQIAASWSIGVVAAFLVAAICISTIDRAFAQSRLDKLRMTASPTDTNRRSRRLRSSFGWICERRRRPITPGAPGNVGLTS